MAGFLSNSQIATITGAFQTHWNTFSTRDVVIFKEPIVTLIQNNDVSFPGYRDSSNEQNYTTTVVSGVFPAMIKYDNNQLSVALIDLDAKLSKGKCYIKVKQDAREFINNGKTEAILVDGMYYRNVSDEGISTLQGLSFFKYTLEKTK